MAFNSNTNGRFYHDSFGQRWCKECQHANYFDPQAGEQAPETCRLCGSSLESLARMCFGDIATDDRKRVLDAKAARRERNKKQGLVFGSRTPKPEAAND